MEASIKAAAASVLSRDVDWSNEAVREFCQTIDEEADRLNALVGNLLDMSRLQSGTPNLVVDELDLEEVVYAALVRVGLDTSNVVVSVGTGVPAVAADRAALERAIANLVDNALNWSPGGATVTIVGTSAGDRVQLRIHDDGSGVSAAEVADVFRPFQRLDDGATAHEHGVGLGLPVARGFVEAMEGSLTIEGIADGPVGAGTTVLIELPAARSAMTADTA
jgi:two-component system, OmpR family, sensor histidine kinase KdpD